MSEWTGVVWRAGLAVALLTVALAPRPTHAQGTACAAVTFPYRTMVRPLADYNTAADMKIAVGEKRIIVTSNGGVRIHCKGGAPLTAQTPLFGANPNTAMFTVTTDGGGILALAHLRSPRDLRRMGQAVLDRRG